MISCKELSIVVQGAVDRSYFKAPYLKNVEGEVTELCLKSLRKSFKGAEIILSTWEGSDVSNLEFDKVVFNKDPGAVIFDEKRGRLQNINRQIVTSLAGVKVATREFVMKIRSDMYFENSNCLMKVDKFTHRLGDYQIFTNFVVIANTTTRNPLREQRCPYHACDWFYLGKKHDIKNIFSIPLMPATYMNWYKYNLFPMNHPDKTNLCRYNSESYIWSECIKKVMPIHFEHTSDLSNNNIEISEKIFANNAIIYNSYELGFKSLKYNWSLSYLEKCYTHNEWKKLYNTYVNRKYFNLRLVDFERKIYVWLRFNVSTGFEPTINSKINIWLYLIMLYKLVLMKSKRVLNKKRNSN